MAKTLTYAAVVILAVIAVVLGFTIYQQTRVSQTPVYQTPPVQQTPDTTVPQTVINQQSGQQDLQSSLRTADEQAVLNFPGPNASEAEKKAHSDLVNKLGNEFGGAVNLDISGCNPRPVVYRVKLGSSFKIKNSDQTEHTIYTDRKTTIKANSEQALASKDIGDNLGDYGYNCNGFTNPVGIIQIVP